MNGAAESKLVALLPLAEVVRAWLEAGDRVVIAEGLFDLLTVAHVRHLSEARARAERLVVAVRGDALASRGGSPPPLVGERDRALLVASLRDVDRVTIHTGDESEVVLRALAGVEHIGCAAADAAAEALSARIRRRHAGA